MPLNQEYSPDIQSLLTSAGSILRDAGDLFSGTWLHPPNNSVHACLMRVSSCFNACLMRVTHPPYTLRRVARAANPFGVFARCSPPSASQLPYFRARRYAGRDGRP
jgi:hypothetical protein